LHTKINIPYGESFNCIRIPTGNLEWVVGPKNTPAVKNLKESIITAFKNPIGSPGLAELVHQHGKKTVVLVDDGTRATPQHLILPLILDELNEAGVNDQDITVIIALGTHRPMDDTECINRFGKDVWERVKIENLSKNGCDFEYLGTTPLGVPIHIYRPYLESDLSIALGNIIPHMYAGWAGGAKMIQPGISSPETTAVTHLMAGPKVYQVLGDVDNPVRREMEDIAVKTGLKFIVNVILNKDNRVVDVVAGDPILAHRKGVEIARPIYTVDINQKPDIVVAGAHPADRDLWQGFKAINNCGMLVKDGGTLILFVSAPEGIAPDHPELIDLGETVGEEVLKMVHRDEIKDKVAAATYLALDKTRSRIHIELVSNGISHKESGRIGLDAHIDFESALKKAIHRHGEKAKIGIVTHGADIMMNNDKEAIYE
jgi:nickel-dependent lactate racemase